MNEITKNISFVFIKFASKDSLEPATPSSVVGSFDLFTNPTKPGVDNNAQNK